MTDSNNTPGLSHTIAAPWVHVPNQDGFNAGLDVVRYDNFVAMLFKAQSWELMNMHAAVGVGGEAGELADVIKRCVIYKSNQTPEGKSIKEGLIEELGDLRFYMQSIMNMHGITESEVLNYNAAKLSKQYQSLRYSDEAANQRADKKTID